MLSFFLKASHYVGALCLIMCFFLNLYGDNFLLMGVIFFFFIFFITIHTFNLAGFLSEHTKRH